MTITLRPEHEKAIAQAIQSGAYQSPDEVIGRALEALLAEDEWLYAHKDEIAEKIERAFGQFDRGEFLSSAESQADMFEAQSGMASQADALMASLYDVSAEAQDDLFEIWQRIAEDSVGLANRIEGEFYHLFESLGRSPVKGTLAKISPNGWSCSFRCILSWWHISRM